MKVAIHVSLAIQVMHVSENLFSSIAYKMF